MVVAIHRHTDSTRCRCRPAWCRWTTTAIVTTVSARSEWSPEFAIHDLDSVDELAAADPADYCDDVAHYLWTWIDEAAGSLRSRMFAANLGVPEDEATGSAAVRITDYLSRDLHITQGKGSVIEHHLEPTGLGAGRRPRRRRRRAAVALAHAMQGR